MSLRQLVLGKFVGALGLYAVLWVVVGALLASLSLGTSLDWGKLAVGLAGLALLYAAALALSLWLSTLASQPAAPAAGAYGLLLLLWLACNATSGDRGIVGALREKPQPIPSLFIITAYLSATPQRLTAWMDKCR